MPKSKTWYSIKAQAGGKPGAAQIHIFDYIGEWGVTARGFVNELKAVEADQIDLHINSPGGSVVDGIAIQNALKHHSANVTTYIDGIAGSIASIIALAGDEIKIADNAYVMIHNPSSIVWGDASDMVKEAEVLDKMANGLAGDYSRKMGISTEEARALMDAETWYLGSEAVDAGFADATYTGTKAAASFDAGRFTAKTPQAVIDRFTQSPPRGKSQSANLNPKEIIVPDKKNATETEAPVETKTEVTGDTPETPEVESPVTEPQAKSVDEQVREALAADRSRAAEITALGNKFGFAADGEAFIASGKSVSDFRAHILGKSPEDWKASLAVKNPTTQASENEGDDSGKDAVAKIKERRKTLYS